MLIKQLAGKILRMKFNEAAVIGRVLIKSLKARREEKSNNPRN